MARLPDVQQNGDPTNRLPNTANLQVCQRGRRGGCLQHGSRGRVDW